MHIALILIIVSVFCVLFTIGREPIPWTRRLRRVHAGVSRKAEWVAPEDVVHQVSNDYLRAIEWLKGAASGTLIYRAPDYLTGRFLTRFQTITNYQTVPNQFHFTGILTARHHPQIRQFSEDGCRCLVVDCQTERRIESRQLDYDGWMIAQDLGDGAVVFQMCYDPNAKRWKIEAFIQELPSGWGNHADAGRVRLSSKLPMTLGRDF